MVSIRCKMIVRAELENLGLHPTSIELGEVKLLEPITSEQRQRLKMALSESGLELMENKKSILIDKIISTIIQLVHFGNDQPPSSKFSDYLSKKLNYDYTYLANLFSHVTGTTIENCFIAHRIEKVKELILYDELNLTEISHKLNYSSVAHLSTQFKKVTGLTPTFFKQLKDKRRVALENVCMNTK